MNIVAHIESKKGDNDHVVLTEDEWFALRDYIQLLRKENERLRWTLADQD